MKDYIIGALFGGFIAYILQQRTQYRELNLKLTTIMSTQAEAAQALKKMKDQLVKANGEIQAKIQALIDAAANSDNVSDELQSAIDELAPAAQQLDDIVPDATDNGGGDGGNGGGVIGDQP